MYVHPFKEKWILHFIAIDIGTTSCKAAIFNHRGHLLDAERTSYPLYFDSSTCEQDPKIWWKSACEASKSVMRKANLSGTEIDAVTCTGQFPSFVCLDKNLEPVRPAIIYSDGRATRESQEIISKIGLRRVSRRMGLPLCFLPTLPLAKLIWLRRNEPNVFRQIRICLGAKDFINLKLTGQTKTDFLEAWWTGAADVHSKSWSNDTLASLKIPRDLFPAIDPASAVVGYVSVEAAKQTKLAPGIPVMVGSVDGMCTMMGAGATVPGTFIDSGGATEIMGSLTRKKLPSSIGDTIFSWDYDEDLRIVYTSTASSGLALQWYRDTFLRGLLQKSYREIDTYAKRKMPNPNEIFFLPHLTGEFSPFYDTSAKAAIVGLSLTHDWIDVYRAILEGVAFSIRQNIEIYSTIGLHIDKIVAVGGAAQSALWNQIKADVTGLPVETRAVYDTGCLGASILAAVGIGLHSNVSEAAGNMTQLKQIFRPNIKNVKKYTPRFQIYSRLYPSLKDRFKEMQT